MEEQNEQTGFAEDETGAQLRRAIRDILGKEPAEIEVKFHDSAPLGPGGIRAGDGSWDGNLYKYRY